MAFSLQPSYRYSLANKCTCIYYNTKETRCYDHCILIIVTIINVDQAIQQEIMIENSKCAGYDNHYLATLSDGPGPERIGSFLGSPSSAGRLPKVTDSTPFSNDASAVSVSARSGTGTLRLN